jgi:hypothetical protein
MRSLVLSNPSSLYSCSGTLGEGWRGGFGATARFEQTPTLPSPEYRWRERKYGMGMVSMLARWEKKRGRLADSSKSLIVDTHLLIPCVLLLSDVPPLLFR